MKNYIDWIILILMLVSIASGYKKGALSSLKWVIGIAVGLLAAPVFSGAVIGILTSLGITNAVTTSASTFDVMGTGMLAGRIMQLVAFAVILYVSKFIVGMILPSAPRHGVGKVIDGIGGAIIGILQVCFVIWLISSLTTISPVTLPVNLTQSPLYNQIAQHNMIHILYHLIPIQQYLVK